MQTRVQNIQDLLLLISLLNSVLISHGREYPDNPTSEGNFATKRKSGKRPLFSISLLLLPFSLPSFCHSFFWPSEREFFYRRMYGCAKPQAYKKRRRRKNIFLPPSLFLLLICAHIISQGKQQKVRKSRLWFLRGMSETLV